MGTNDDQNSQTEHFHPGLDEQTPPLSVLHIRRRDDEAQQKQNVKSQNHNTRTLNNPVMHAIPAIVDDTVYHTQTPARTITIAPPIKVIMAPVRPPSLLSPIPMSIN